MRFKVIFILINFFGTTFSIAQYKLTYSDTLMVLGTQAYQKLDLLNAKDKLDSCIFLNPNNDECKYYRAKIEFEMKSYQKASVMFKNVLALKDMDASSWHMLGLCFTKMKHYDSADFCFRNAVKINSKRSEFYANWANNQLLQGNIERAEQIYTTAILLDDKNAQYYYQRAEIREKLGDKMKAEEDIVLAASLDPNNSLIKQKMKSNQKFNLKWLIAFICLAFGFFVLLFYRNKKKSSQ